MEYSRRKILMAGTAAGMLALPGCSSLPGLSLTEAIKLILDGRREDALRGLPPDAERETVKVA